MHRYYHHHHHWLQNAPSPCGVGIVVAGTRGQSLPRLRWDWKKPRGGAARRGRKLSAPAQRRAAAWPIRNGACGGEPTAGARPARQFAECEIDPGCCEGGGSRDRRARLQASPPRDCPICTGMWCEAAKLLSSPMTVPLLLPLARRRPCDYSGCHTAQTAKERQQSLVPSRQWRAPALPFGATHSGQMGAPAGDLRKTQVSKAIYNK